MPFNKRLPALIALAWITTFIPVAHTNWAEKMAEQFNMEKWLKDVDSNNERIIEAKEKRRALLKSDSNSDGVVHLCEIAPEMWEVYNMDPRMGVFIPTDDEGVLSLEMATTVYLGTIDDDKDGKISLEEFTRGEIEFMKHIANKAYDAVNGPMKSDPSNPEIAHDVIEQLARNMDKNKNGYIEAADFDLTPTPDRCQFVSSGSASTGATRWMMNHVFTVMDSNRRGLCDEDFVYTNIYRADGNKDGRTTVQEAIAFAKAKLRAARLYAGLNFNNPWTCEGVEDVEPLVAQMALDMDLDQDGEITPPEMLQYLLLVDDNGDEVLQMGELVDKLVNRYSFNKDLAFQIFKEMDTNDDNEVDFHTDNIFFSMDTNLDGLVTVCEGIRGVRDWVEAGARNLASSGHCAADDQNGCGHQGSLADDVKKMNGD